MTIKVEHLFSNGTEYESFLEENCFKCKRFVEYDDETPENPVCPIEETIFLSGVGRAKDFPVEKLIENEYMHRYDCKDKIND